jgi:hypothetical protein
MKSFQSIYSSIQTQLFDTTTTASGALPLTKTWINNSVQRRTNDPRALVFLETSATDTTQAGVQFLPAPYSFGKMLPGGLTVLVGTTLYTPAEAPNLLFWNRLNYIGSTGSYQSQVPYFYYIQGSGNAQKVGLYPTPSNTGEVITYNYQLKARELTQDDYTTGTITTVATVNDVSTFTGSGTSWTAQMVGRWIQLPVTQSGGLSVTDGYWYQIASVPTSTTLTTVQPYSVATGFSAQSFAYTIGEMSVIPEGYEDIIEEDVLARHYRRIQNLELATVHQQMADDRFEQLLVDKGSKVSGPYSAPQVDLQVPNINSFPSNLTGF